MEVQIGDTVTCAETGKSFVVARDGCSFNYAIRNGGAEIVSDEGVNLAERRALLDRSKPFVAYVSSDGKHVTGWKGNVLGAIVSTNQIRLTRLSYTHGKHIYCYRVRDVHGAYWFGRGNPGICITLRAMNAPR